MAKEKQNPKSLDECCGEQLTWKDLQEIDYEGKRAKCKKCNKLYEQNLLTGNIYIKRPNDDNFKHLGCGEEILVVKRSHPILGTGIPPIIERRHRYEDIPYCPKCEEKPQSSGKTVCSYTSNF